MSMSKFGKSHYVIQICSRKQNWEGLGLELASFHLKEFTVFQISLTFDDLTHTHLSLVRVQLIETCGLHPGPVFI